MNYAKCVFIQTTPEPLLGLDTELTRLQQLVSFVDLFCLPLYQVRSLTRPFRKLNLASITSGPF